MLNLNVKSVKSDIKQVSWPLPYLYVSGTRTSTFSAIEVCFHCISLQFLYSCLSFSLHLQLWISYCFFFLSLSNTPSHIGTSPLQPAGRVKVRHPAVSAFHLSPLMERWGPPDVCECEVWDLPPTASPPQIHTLTVHTHITSSLQGTHFTQTSILNTCYSINGNTVFRYILGQVGLCGLAREGCRRNMGRWGNSVQQSYTIRALVHLNSSRSLSLLVVLALSQYFCILLTSYVVVYVTVLYFKLGTHIFVLVYW